MSSREANRQIFMAVVFLSVMNIFPSGYTAGFPVPGLAFNKDKRIISKAVDFDEKYVG